jgi:DNA-binding winged helix-turn-helix (wHTH) protein
VLSSWRFLLDPTNRLLKVGHVPVSLSPKAFDALVYLARNPGRLLTREELLQALWPNSHVEEGNLSVHIFQIRKALGMAGDGKAFTRPCRRRGTGLMLK